jgi:hypothetical protein
VARTDHSEGGALRRGAAYAGWALIAIAALELCAREVARKSILLAVTGIELSNWSLVAMAVAAAAVMGALQAGAPDLKAGAPDLKVGPTGSVLKFGPTRPVALVFAVLFTLGVALQLQLGARLQSDGFYYFAYLRSLAFDRDVDFTNDYKLLGLGDKPHLFVPTATGHAQSAWTIGPAIVWSPFFFAAHPVAHALASRGADVSTNGNSYPYRQAVCIAGLFYGLLGCWFTWRLTKLFFERRLSAAATALVVLGSFMLWYFVKEPSMTHAPSMAGAAAFAGMWAATRDRRTLRQWALLGALGGFIALIRWQNVLFALLPACDALVQLAGASSRKDKEQLRATLIAGAVFTAGAALAFVPQMLAWRAIYGSYLAVSPVGPQIRWWGPQLVDILWSSRNGLFSWSPALYVAAAGLLLLAWTRPAIGVPSLVCTAVMVYFNASIQDWWGSAGFGGRRFDGTIPLFALGAAAIGERAIAWTRRHPFRLLSAAAAMLVLWNLTLMKAAQDGQVRIGEAVSFGEAGAYQARAFHRWFGHPATYPVSLLFAARNRLPIGAYDLLSANRFLGDPLRPYGRIDIGTDDDLLIEDGWHGPERDGSVTFRWAASPATVLVPLDRTADLTVQVRIQSFNYPGAGPQTMNAYVNGRPVANGLGVPPEWTTVEFVTEARAWRTGVNRLRLEFTRATRPVDVSLGGDARSLSAAIDYVRVQVR